MTGNARRFARSPTRGGALLFVYGTLRPCTATPTARWLATVAEHLGEARTRGRLYDLGPYPALTHAERDDEWVVGDLYRLRSPITTLRVLDAYEGGPNGRGRPQYARIEREVEAGSRSVRAWLYLYQRSVLRARRIASGDYARAIADGLCRMSAIGDSGDA